MNVVKYILMGSAALLPVLFTACDDIPDEMAECTIEPEPGSGSEPGSDSDIEAVDLGLSVAWGSSNLGAASPEKVGDYYCFGALSGSATTCTTDVMNICNTKYDAARQTLGLGWRLPTKAELEELMIMCTVEVAAQNGKHGFRVTGWNGNSIFLPLSGYRKYGSTYDSDYAYIASGERSYHSVAEGAYFLSLYEKYDYSISKTIDSEYGYYYSYPIRPVYDASLVK